MVVNFKGKERGTIKPKINISQLLKTQTTNHNLTGLLISICYYNF